MSDQFELIRKIQIMNFNFRKQTNIAPNAVYVGRETEYKLRVHFANYLSVDFPENPQIMGIKIITVDDNPNYLAVGFVMEDIEQ